MANKRAQQFLWNYNPMLTMICGSISVVQEVKASVVTQGITLTADAFGTSGNLISIAFTAGGTAGAEVVTVVGNAISVQIDSGVSTVTQVRTAINAAGASAALVDATGTSAATVSAAAAVFLTGGIDGVASSSMNGVSSVVQSGVGTYTITLEEKYNAFLGAQFQVLAASAVDLVPQLVSADVTSAKTIVFKLLAGATPTDPSAALTVYPLILVRNSSVSK